MDRDINSLEQMIRFTTQRHKVLSSNVANADTPGYRAKDLEFRAAMEDAMGVNRTNDAHIPASGGVEGGGQATLRDDRPWSDENNVELDIEMSRLTENALAHEAALKLISKKLAMYRMAITGR